MYTILEKLISFPSITPHDVGCQEFIIEYLEKLNFECRRFNLNKVSNFFARLGKSDPLLIFAGHTDVVNTGDHWQTDPFILSEKNGYLYGRGVADMKGSIACMLDAVTHFSKTNFNGSIGCLITSAEEGDDFLQGTPYVLSELIKNNYTLPKYCIIGEPSSEKTICDTIKIGRRGSLNALITIHGKQGHVAYPHLAINPTHIAAPAIAELVAINWDYGNQYFQPTTLQITELTSGGIGKNIIPDQLILQCNLRFSTERTVEDLQQQIITCLNKHKLNFTIDWQLSGEPFLTKNGKLLENTIKAIEEVTKLTPQLSTNGGTSDGRFIAPYNIETVELGLNNTTIHQVNENILATDLIKLRDVYYKICQNLLQ